MGTVYELVIRDYKVIQQMDFLLNKDFLFKLHLKTKAFALQICVILLQPIQ